MLPPEALPLIAVCTPGSEFSWMWVHQWSNFLPRVMQEHSVCLGMAVSNNIYTVRNRCVENVLEATKKDRLDYCLWIDSDNLVTFEQFLVLKETLEKRPDLAGIGGWYYINSNGETGVDVAAGWFDGDTHLTVEQIEAAGDEPIEVDYIGFGFLLMRGGVISMSPKPFTPVLEDSGFGCLADDSSFLLRAKQQGFKFAVHPRVHVPHLKISVIGPQALIPVAKLP